MSTILPTDAEARLEFPMFSGLLAYFPRACAAVAHHSFIGNEQHNPGEPMHWAKEKSIGKGDKILRHLTEGMADKSPLGTEAWGTEVEHLAACAWRSLELLERKLAGMPPFAKDGE